MAAHPVAVLVIASLIAWGAVSIVVGLDGQRGVLLGMFAPLVAAVGTWRAVERAHKRAPEQVSALMIKLFAVKMIGFGAYVASVVLLFPLDRLSFVASFVTQYILLHFLEALYLRRLFSGGEPAGQQLHGR